MYYKLVSISERMPERGEFVPCIDVDGNVVIYRWTPDGWNMRDGMSDNSPNNNLPITAWLEKTEGEPEKEPIIDPFMGKKVKDIITGFEGIATSVHHYITGCDQYAVQPPVGENAKIPEPRYFDYTRLIITGDGVSLPTAINDSEKGCDEREHP